MRGGWIIVEYEFRHPSYPGSNDGYLKILKVTLNTTIEGPIGTIGRYLPNLENLSISIESKDLHGKYQGNVIDSQWVNAKEGTYTIKIFEYDDFTGGSLEITLGKLPPIPEPNLILVAANNETCPGSSDGSVVLEVNNFPSGSQPLIEWIPPAITPEPIVLPNNVVRFIRSDLTAGTYPFTLSYRFEDHICCQNGSVIINTNSCLEKLFFDPFTGDLSSEYFVEPPNSVTTNSGVALYDMNALLGIPWDVSIPSTKAMSVNFSYVGNGPVQIVDPEITSIASQPFLGSGVLKISLLENIIAHGYVDIQADAGSFIDNLCIVYFSEEIQKLNCFKPGTKNTVSRSNTIEPYCIGDTIYPYDGFSISGGISPYDFRWALDGDMVFDDADSISHPIFFENVGLQNIALLIEDLVGQRDTLLFEYEVNARDSVFLSIPDLNIDTSNFTRHIVYLDQAEFQIVPMPATASLTTSSLGLNGTSFSPVIAGIGDHVIVVSGNDCDAYAILIVSVIEEANSSFTTPPTIYNCSDNVALNTLLTGDTTGFWILNYSFILFSDTLRTSLLPEDVYKLSYIIGGDDCIFESSAQFSVHPSPIAMINGPAEGVLSSDLPIDLNTLLDISSTMGGTWTGGAYVIGEQFDPIGLIPGFHPVYYTVGEGSCQVSDTIQIEVILCSPNPIISEIEVTICEVEDYEEYTVSGTYLDTLMSISGCDSIVEIELLVLDMNHPDCIGTFLNEVGKENGIFIYPNPTMSDLRLKCNKDGKYTYTIYGINGHKIKKGKVIVFETNGSINLSNFKKGIYFLEIKKGSEKSTITKFLKI
ncbi:MAG: hypothetical protein ACJATI_005106 [Halioglobus sp.]